MTEISTQEDLSELDRAQRVDWLKARGIDQLRILDALLVDPTLEHFCHEIARQHSVDSASLR